MSNGNPECEVFEVRLLIDKETGHIWDVEPIDKEKYVSKEIKNLTGSNIIGANVMTFSHASPGCTEWRTIKTPNGYRRICVRHS